MSKYEQNHCHPVGAPLAGAREGSVLIGREILSAAKDDKYPLSLV
jgi:hypothetical protein